MSESLDHLPANVSEAFEAAGAKIGFPGHMVLFMSCQVLNYPLSFAFSRLPPSVFKHIIAIAGGLLLGWIVYGYSFVHCLILPLICYALLYIAPDHPALTTLFSLGYLAYHCLMNMLFYHLGSRIDFTMALMIAAVKTSTCAFSYSDGRRLKMGGILTGNERVDQLLKSRAIDHLPSLLHYYSYILFFPAMLTGPCFNFKHYLNSMETAIDTVGLQFISLVLTIHFVASFKHSKSILSTCQGNIVHGWGYCIPISANRICRFSLVQKVFVD
jgi:D-alanyl-lipoteichoic acid acyltransferase DltB (MBOAT superfamily)